MVLDGTDNRVGDLAALAGLVGLRRLMLGGNAAGDVEALAALSTGMT